MKNILFIVRGIKADFLCDMIYHGLTQLNDINIEIITKDGDYRWMFINQSTQQQRWKEWGHGFTVTNIVNPEKKHLINQEQAENKIKNHYYDCIIYGSIERCCFLQDLIMKQYPKEKIIYIMGDDQIGHDWKKDKLLKERIIKRSKQGIYFKRELDNELIKYCKPISFAVPECKIAENISQKKIHTALIYPGKKETYIYKDQKSYYQGYKDALFGYTFKKAGWDCLRHYEIMMNGCIPYFTDIQKCPTFCMINLPKDIIKYTNTLFNIDYKKHMNELLYFCNFYLNYCKKYLTTKELAKYILSYLEE